MRRSVFVIFLTVVCVCAAAQNTLLLPYSATRLTDEERTTYPDRLAYPTELKNLVANEVGFACNTPPVTVLTGTFSVSPNLQVTFSPGNLQYNATKGTHECADGTTQQGTWRFAGHQWDYVGDATQGTVYENGVKCDNELVSATYDGWIDWFGWGTSGWNSGANAYQPWATSTSASDYYPGGSYANNLTDAYANADWGIYNQIGEDAPGSWRTLTKDEWVYLFHGRLNYANLFGLGTVNGITGTIILPDDWVLPSGMTFSPSTSNDLSWDSSYDYYYNSNGNNYSHNTYTKEQWENMESAGAVFLPAAGYRDGTSVHYVADSGIYWSSTAYSSGYAYFLYFLSNRLLAGGSGNRGYGRSVRLVKDSVILPTYVPKPFSVSETRQVTFSPGNLQYNAALGSHQCANGAIQQGTWRFAEHQWDFVGDAENGTVYENGIKCDNDLLSKTYNGWIDLFGWGTSGWNSGAKAYQPWASSKKISDYCPGGDPDNNLTDAYAYSDWGQYNAIGTDPAGTWRTLTTEE